MWAPIPIRPPIPAAIMLITPAPRPAGAAARLWRFPLFGGQFEIRVDRFARVDGAFKDRIVCHFESGFYLRTLAQDSGCLKAVGHSSERGEQRIFVRRLGNMDRRDFPALQRTGGGLRDRHNNGLIQVAPPPRPKAAAPFAEWISTQAGPAASAASASGVRSSEGRVS
jgi:hypothetical protein